MTTPAFIDLDLRLRDGQGTPAARLAEVIADHDTGESGARCPGSGWRAGRGRGCPSAAVARALKDRRPLPSWLDHLAVPGIPAPRPSRQDQRDAEDSLPGLFPAPARTTRGSA